MAKGSKRMTPEIRRLILRMRAQGATLVEIAAKIGCSDGTVMYHVRPLGGVIRQEMWRTSDSRLSLDERVEIKIGLGRDISFRAIAREIRRNVSTVSREVNGNGGRTGYQPAAAHRRARERARRPKRTKLEMNLPLRCRVISGLELLWSPQQISRRLRDEFGDDRSMHISHETIYKSLYVQGRGELRRELARCLRTGRATRVAQNRTERRGKIPGMVMISERPAEASDRAVPGHWEGDLILGKGGKSAIGTLVERSTRYVLLYRLPNGKTAEDVRVAMTKVITQLPESLRRTLTVDQGLEMAQHIRFTVDTGVQVYFCDPRSPWQRGSNENTNGLLRQYFPKGMDLSKVTDEDIRRAQDGLNGRPRMTLGWKNPAEKLSEFVALTG